MSNPQKYTVGWICAVTTEFVAARAFFDEKHDQLETIADNDNNNYALGRIGKHNVVMAVLPKSEYGTTSAATVARDMLRSFPNIRFGLMVGIGGGAPSAKHDIRLGDVIVSTRGNGKGGVFQYDYGKAIQEHAFVATGSLNQPPQLLLTALSALEAEYELEGHQLSAHVDRALEQWPRLRQKYSRPPLDSDRLYRPDVVHPDSSKECGDVCSDDPACLVYRKERGEQEDDPAIHYGLVASANQLMKDALARDKLAASMDVLCFEMEAAGLMNHFPCLVIRGICDYSDSHKNKEWQGFAAMMAAAYAKDLLRQIPPSKVEAEKPISEILSSRNETKYAVMSMASDHRFAKIERWLSPPDCSTNANLARKRRHPGTGTWLLNSPAFQEWKLGSRQHLWLHGLAGCGKTILSTTILDHLLQIDTYITLAFFFDFSDPRKQKLEDLLRSLAVQLYHTGNEAARRLDSLFASHDDGRRQPDTTALSACVDTMIQTAGKVFIIIDALDECTAREELLQWLKDLASRKAQLIVTGRPEVEFQSAIPRSFGKRNCVQLDNNVVNVDIRSYVEATLEQKPDFVDKKLSPSILEEIRDKIGDGADGMFRWAACQLETLARCLSPSAIEIALMSLPRDLNETYRRMVQNIPSEYKSSAIRLLQFLVHTRRPLTLPEAVEVVATEINQEPRGFDVKRRLFQAADILRYCPSLVTIAEATNYAETVDELHLAHFSVKEYLLEQAQFDLESASIVITRTCLTYLGDIKNNCSTIRSDFPMAQYAAEYWTEYAVLAETSEDIVRITVNFLKDETTFQRWCRLYQADCQWGDEPGPPRAPRLYYACLAGLTGAARDLMTEGADVNAQSGEYGNALQAASFNGNLRVVQLLLDKGADVNVEGGKYGNALQAASSRGHLEVVQLLLDKGADVNAQGGEYGNALQAASHSGNLDVVQLLLDKGADVNAEDGIYGNALPAASSRGHLEVVQLLLDKGADVNAQGGEHGNALYAASLNGNLEVVQLLLDKGADVNAEGGIYGNAVQVAVINDHQEVVQLLLDKGADVNAEGGAWFGWYGNALPAALHNGNLEIVQLLLDNGADVNAEDYRYGNALQAALHNGNLEIVQLLLDKGADVNAQGGKHGNALQAALHNGNLEIVQLLLDKGADVNAQGGKHGNALQVALSSGRLEVVQLLLNNGADVNAEDYRYGNALQAASLESDLEVVQLLLDKGADVNAQGGEYGNALQAASLNGNQEVMQLLLDKGADINAQGGEYGNALQAALYFGNLEIVQLLLDNGADVNAQGGQYGNALQAASSRGHLEMLTHRAAKYGNALQAASFNGNLRVVQLLLDNGADVNVEGGEYGNALPAASSRGHLEVVQLLLNNGADVNAEDYRYGNALQAASLESDLEVMQLLLDKGADVNAQGGKYGNALQAASYEGNLEKSCNCF
uniref:NACHT domain-containing protein n=1 Tax=Fusarium oxysporum (strain Fo5176) TaxID=660025 RepID=A0A0D2YEN9_FUSOF